MATDDYDKFLRGKPVYEAVLALDTSGKGITHFIARFPLSFV